MAVVGGHRGCRNTSLLAAGITPAAAIVLFLLAMTMIIYAY
ncbi:putative membrane protein [Collimonas pratensis]|uniref:Membrane protein n=1 Tax=Collimonas pratensis TaxID=279113 RepID=A0A127QYR1_9BURK|nr:putative membrane protein [Collimonas pratensis]AMP15146.1 putative membrane protein [Collimonas pratensis]